MGSSGGAFAQDWPVFKCGLNSNFLVSNGRLPHGSAGRIHLEMHLGREDDSDGIVDDAYSGSAE